MTKIFILKLVVLFSLITSPVDVQANRLDLLAEESSLAPEGINNILFYGLIAKRCGRYLISFEVFDCQNSVSQMVVKLDTDFLFPENELEGPLSFKWPGPFFLVAFKKDLINLLASKETTNYLTKINTELNKYLSNEIPKFNLWDSSLDFYLTEEKTARAIATLFQDSSPGMLHLNYLERVSIRPTGSYLQNKELLRTTIESLNNVLDYNEDKRIKILYPSYIKEDLNKNLYHFYVPYHLSLMLHKITPNKKMAYVAPMLMTLTYEFISTASDFSYFFKDPQTLNRSKYSWKIRDIMAGHLGASRGGQKRYPKDLDFLLDSFSKSTANTVKSMLLIR